MTTETIIQAAAAPAPVAAPAAETAATATAPAAAPTPAPAPAAPIAAGNAEDKPTAAPANWPDNWRDMLASGDEKARKQLERMSSPSDVLKAWRELEQKKGSGALMAKAPDGKNPEEMARWRADNGIPESPDKYDTTLPDGLVIGDDDKQMLGGFLKQMHDKNVHPEVVKTALGWYYQQQDQQIAQQSESDMAYRRQTEDALRAEWGGDYRANVNAVADFLVGKFGPEVGGQLHMARMPDGTILGNNPQVLKALASIAREIDPGATVVPGASNHGAAIASELEQIQKTMRDEPQKYWKDPKMQTRFGELLAVQEKLSKRG